MIGLGFQETVSMILSNGEDEFRKMNLPEEEACEAVNPVAIECTMCRKRVLPSLLRVLSNNKHRDYPQPIFELGDVVVPDKAEETGAMTVKMLSCAVSNSTVSYEEISSYLDAFMKSLGLNYKMRKGSHKSLIDGRCAEIVVDNKSIGVIGEIHPHVLENWNLEKPAVAFELNVDEIFKMKK
jgi:phenylalanyl-tRNA synthetase beta chain